MNKRNYNLERNKKGDKLISVYWFIVLVIIATGIVLMVNVFYKSPYDIRELEAEILAQKVADCVYFGGEIDKRLIAPTGVFREDFRDNFLKSCSLNFSLNNEFLRPQYYVEVNFTTNERKPKTVFSLSGGNKNWISDCPIEVDEKSKLVVCSKKEFFVVDSSGKIYVVNVLSIVGKGDQNV